MHVAAYPLQLSGHRPILIHNNYLLKPLIKEEYDFYRRQSEHAPLLPFLPTFYGITYIKQEQATSPDSCESDLTTSVSGELIRREISLSRRFISFCFYPSIIFHNSYLAIQNLTALFIKPCVMDLKMGIIQSNEDATTEKLQSRKQKCEESTSLECGVRLGGIFHACPPPSLSDSSLFRNKYYGRLLQEEQLRHALFSFLICHNTFRTDICALFLERLLILRDVVTDLSYKQKKLNIFGASIIFLYEPPKPQSDKSRIAPPLHIDLRLIDFGHTSHMFSFFLFF